MVISLIRSKKTRSITEKTIQLVQKELPPQPWPTGIHKTIAAKLGLSNSESSYAIHVLISRGIFKHQVDGKVVESK